MDITQFSWQAVTGWLATCLTMLLLVTSNSYADEAPVPINAPSTLTANIVPGMQSVEIAFGLSGIDGVIIEVVAPIDGVSFSLIGPTGVATIASGDPEVTFTPGTEIAPGQSLPGGVFATQELSAPADGTWVIHLEFPTSPHSTVAVATVFTRTAYQAGITLVRESYLVGEDVSIGMLVLNNGLPVTGLAPEIEVSLKGSLTTPVKMTGMDDGVNPDGLANDGVYSIDYTFPLAGSYLIKGVAGIPTPQALITREANRMVSIIDPPLSVVSVTSNTLAGSGNCIAGIEEQVVLNVVVPGEYIVRGTLAAGRGAVLEKRQRNIMGTGVSTITLLYSSQEIMQGLGENGPYTFAELDVLSLKNNEFTLASRGVDVGSTQLVDINALCRDPIEVGTGLTVNTVLSDNYISALEFGVPINVQRAGSYKFSFKVIGAAGEDIELIGFTQYLTEGSNIAAFTLPADRFQAADGPYAVISALVTGLGRTAQLSWVGETPAHQRWQFLPTREGDLDGDNDVDADDREHILAARNHTALTPGDRRDIIRDGQIDLRDVRAILKLR